jgi:hypothetical protein
VNHPAEDNPAPPVAAGRRTTERPLTGFRDGLSAYWGRGQAPVTNKRQSRMFIAIA